MELFRVSGWRYGQKSSAIELNSEPITVALKRKQGRSQMLPAELDGPMLGYNARMQSMGYDSSVL